MKINKISLKRLVFLIFFLFIFNAYFFSDIFKHIPVPVLNCYANPTATFACPIGTIQHFLVVNSFSFFTIGMILLVGFFIGRMTCGWACPFGFVQELINKIPLPHIRPPEWLRYGKYLFLLIPVVLLPIFWVDKSGYSVTYFCKICPSGALGAGIPQVLLHPEFKNLLGLQFVAKMSILAFIVIAVIFNNRFFCKYICPLGAMLGAANKVSMIQMKLDIDKCVKCNRCQSVCPTDIKIYEEPDSPECIRCMECVKVCPTKCISVGTKNL